MEGKCLEYPEFPEYIGQTLNIKNKQIKEIVESSNKNEKQCLSFFDYSVGENVYVLKDNNWVSAIVEQILSYGIKVKLSFGYQMIANTNSICRKIS
jgi:sRNA-binding protein